MRRIVALILGLMLLVVPAVAGAQDSKLLWDLDKTFTVSDLGFQFKYPKAWITDTSNGIRIAETQADLDAVLDSDDTTQAKGYTISLNAIPVDALGLDADAKLEDIVDMLVKSAGVTETEGRIEVPVLTHRAITVIGTNAGDKPGLGTIWLQDGYVVLFNLGATALNGDVGFSWGNILGSMTPVDALNLSKDTLTSPDGDFTMGYPEKWFAGEAGSGLVAELESDLSSSSPVPEGIASIIIEGKFSDFDKSVKDLDTLVEFLKQSQGWTNEKQVITSERIILNNPAVTLSGAKGESNWAEITATTMDDKAIVIATFYPNEDRFNEFRPTAISMLQSLKAAETSS